MAFFAQKVWVEWLEQALANGEYNHQDYKDLSDIEQIGSSKVYKALMKKDDDETMVTLKYIGNKLSTREVVSELKLLRKIQSFNNEYISRFYGVTKSDVSDKNQLKYMVVLEYGDGGTLKEYLQNNSENLHWSVRLKFARQLSKAITFLHENKLIHRNLHSDNIIINEQDLKLKALGITCKMSESSSVLVNTQKFLAYIDPQYFNIPNYKSSEDKQAALTKESDIYSLGVILWELTSGRLPFSSEEHSDLQKEIMGGLREKDIDGIDKGYIEIYKACWHSDPDDRPEIQEVVSALEGLDDGIDPSLVQEKKEKPKRKFTLKEPAAPVPPAPPATKPVKPSSNKTTKPQSDPKPPKPQSDPKPPKPQNDPKPPKPQNEISKSPKPQSDSKPPQSQKQNNKPPQPAPTNRLTVPKTARPRSVSPAKSRSKSPSSKRVKSPTSITTETIIEEDGDEVSEILNSPVESESSSMSAITIKSDAMLRTHSPASRSKSPLSHRSISPVPVKKSHTLKERKQQSPARRSRPKSMISKSPSRKEPTRAKSPNFTARQPRTLKRSLSVSTPRQPQKTLLRRSLTVAPPRPPKSPSPPRCKSPRKSSYKPMDRRYSTSFINSAMQINAQSSLVGLWSNSFDRSREDPTKKIVDELLSLFMDNYEVNPGDTLLKSIKEFLENQEDETIKIFDWLVTTQLSLQYKILLGYFYLNGIGTPVENRKAFVLFLSAAKKQYAIAQDLLGSCYLNGKGTVKDEVLAFEWHQKAAANGSATAFLNLGECYHNGYGTVKSKGKALQFFKMASDGGNVCGRNMFAFCYEMGLGISSDHKKAFYLYKQAADAGYKLAQQNVAKCYQKGIGVAIDLEAAEYWLEKSNQE